MNQRCCWTNPAWPTRRRTLMPDDREPRHPAPNESRCSITCWVVYHGPCESKRSLASAEVWGREKYPNNSPLRLHTFTAPAAFRMTSAWSSFKMICVISFPPLYFWRQGGRQSTGRAEGPGIFPAKAGHPLAGRPWMEMASTTTILGPTGPFLVLDSSPCVGGFEGSIVWPLPTSSR